MKTVISLLGIITLLTLSNCKRFDDTVLQVKVVDSQTEDPVSAIRIDVFKLTEKHDYRTLFGTKVKKVDTYYAYTDRNGIAKISIDNYNRKKYWYFVEGNTGNNQLRINSFYPSSLILEVDQLNETVIFRLY